MHVENPMPSLIRFLVIAFCVAMPGYVAAQAPTWKGWSPSLFEQAKKEDRLVILDVEAVWCHWCHVMHETTYANPEVQTILSEHYITVRVDQDSNPEISHRYEEYGWPATIIFAPDGSELAKRRGYIEPAEMKELLTSLAKTRKAEVEKPTRYAPASSPLLAAKERKRIETVYAEIYDKKYGGWGSMHKFLSADVMEYTLRKALEGKAGFREKANQTLNASFNLLDPVWGGVYQYSDEVDWRSPHFEKIMEVQTDYIESYALAYATFDDVAYKDAAYSIVGYLERFMKDSGGAFYTSQDADVDEKISGKMFYRKDEAGRAQYTAPTIDKHIYARENAWVIRAFTYLYNITGDKALLDSAMRAADWVMKNRSLEGGGFRHGESDNGGPFLGDTLFMGDAFLHLYRSTGDRKWLERALAAAHFIQDHFLYKDGGFATSSLKQPVTGNQQALAFKDPVRKPEENITATRFFNLLSHITGDKTYRASAEHGMRFLASPGFIADSPFRPGILLAAEEIANPPVHITIVGAKDDEAAQTLYNAALRYPGTYTRIEWWDKKEGPMPNVDVSYPELPTAAAFACANGQCSLPITDATKLLPKVGQFMGAAKPNKENRKP
ncbi:MAG: thioredoxin domain-containing protein [Proteobacteria bacterium]|nr:thioredoxin domain-containing protein [Pseudomonadota bacterium]